MTTEAEAPTDTPTAVTTQQVTYRVGESCFSLQQTTQQATGEIDSLLSLFHGHRTDRHQLVSAPGQPLALAVAPIQGDNGAYIGLLTGPVEGQYLVTVILESTKGVSQQQQWVGFEADLTKDDLVLDYNHPHNTVFITSHRQDGTVCQLPDFFKGLHE